MNDLVTPLFVVFLSPHVAGEVELIEALTIDQAVLEQVVCVRVYGVRKWSLATAVDLDRMALSLWWSTKHAHDPKIC